MKKDGSDKAKYRDSGLALVLIFLLLHHFSRIKGWFPETGYRFVSLAIVALIISMACPSLMKPFSKVWFVLAGLLSAVVPKILLSIIFFFVLTPVGLFRRMTGSDSMKLKEWKKGNNSVFEDRNITFSKDNINKTF